MRRSKLKTFFVWLPTLLVSVFLFFGALTADVSAQSSSFTPPTLLPGENWDIGGYENLCIGLADKIRNGDIHLRELPCFIKYFAQTLAGIAGSISVIFVMFGGYMLVFQGEEQRDKAKKTITYALLGLAISLLAWVITDVVLQLATE